MMLQQTQVDRVLPKYSAFLKRFPNITALATAPLSAVLKEWQGLGYNRRAKYLHEAGKAVVAIHSGIIPRSKEVLMALPGVGHYTAGAIRAFAFDEPDDCIETNIRTVLTHHLFSHRKKVSDQELLIILPRVRGKTSPRTFYAAMMDYGAFLKLRGVRINHKKKGYVKQKPFKGSMREVRGAVLRTLLYEQRLQSLHYPQVLIQKAIQELGDEGLIPKIGRKFVLPK
jgi:A/G-specific adenine glycosylase